MDARPVEQRSGEPGFGCLMTDGGMGFSWAINSQQNKSTPWWQRSGEQSPPRSDLPARPRYRRGRAATTLLPYPRKRIGTPFIMARATVSLFEHTSHTIVQRLHVLVTRRTRWSRATGMLRNTSNRRRRLRATYYAEWVLGVNRADVQQFTVTNLRRNKRRNPRAQFLQSRLSNARRLCGLCFAVEPLDD